MKKHLLGSGGKMKIDVWHFVKTCGSISAGHIGRYRFSELPHIGDTVVYYDRNDDPQEYIVTEIIFNLKRFGKTQINIHVENKKHD